MKHHCWNGPSPLGHRPSRPSPRGLSARGRGRGALRRSTATSNQASGGAVRWGRGSKRWPVRWGIQFGHRRRRLTRGWFPLGHGSVGGEQWWGAASGGGGRRLAAREGGRGMGGCWGGVDGARRWLEAARKWSAIAKHASAAEEWGQWEGVRRSRSGREFLHCNHAWWIGAHVADVHDGARATGAWPSSCRACLRPVTLFWFNKIFKYPNFDIWIGDLPNVQISPNVAGRHVGIQGATLLFGSISKSQRIASLKFWHKFKFESSLNFKGIQTFLKKSHKFYKIPYPHYILYYKFTLTHLYSNIGSFFTSGNRYLVYFILNRVDHLRVLPPLSQVYHCSKMDKECSQVTYKYCTSIWVTCAV
jgi:hypothetical protein